jgi:hypothetical protein
MILVLARAEKSTSTVAERTKLGRPSCARLRSISRILTNGLDGIRGPNKAKLA